MYIPLHFPNSLFIRIALPILLLSPLCLPATESKPFVWRQADKLRTFKFPADFGAHPKYKTEWWYLTGSLRTQEGSPFGFQATWFRHALIPKPERASTLATHEIFMFHGSLTDIANKKFHNEQRYCRGASNWAGAAPGKLNVFLLENKLQLNPDQSWHLHYKVKNRIIDLTLKATSTPLLHGRQPGLSQKGPKLGQASYYVSIPRMQAEGWIQENANSKRVKVSGDVWYDQEFGSNQLSKEQLGWDWFSVALDDGTDLMIYKIRKKNNQTEPNSSGTIRVSKGKSTHLKISDFSIEVLAHWKSPHTSGTYPIRWRIKIPSKNLNLTVTPLLQDQEIWSEKKKEVNYWEGLCRFEGLHNGKQVSGSGYVELVGYAGGINGKF